MGVRNPALSGNIRRMEGSAFFDKLFSNLVTIGFVVGGIVFLFIFLWGGIQWITSGGDKVANESARQKLTNGLAGIVILLGLYAIINLVEIFFGTSITSFNVNDLTL